MNKPEPNAPQRPSGAPKVRRSKPADGFSANSLTLLLVVLLAIPYIGAWGYKKWIDNRLEKELRAALIIIDKENLTLELQSYTGQTLMRTGISCGSSFGNKQEKGDMRTPEGVFHICDIQDASSWKHDFNDGKGTIEGAYGPWFLRLETPGHKGIGIHGTHNPASIGTRATEGCIRLRNEDVAALKERVYVGMPVVILPSQSDTRQTAADIAGKGDKDNKGSQGAD